MLRGRLRNDADWRRHAIDRGSGRSRRRRIYKRRARPCRERRLHRLLITTEGATMRTRPWHRAAVSCTLFALLNMSACSPEDDEPATTTSAALSAGGTLDASATEVQREQGVIVAFYGLRRTDVNI